jgi:hypothetical protein
MQEDWTTIGESKGEKHHLILSRKKARRGKAATQRKPVFAKASAFAPASVFAKLRRDKSARQDAEANAFNAEARRTQSFAELFSLTTDGHGWTRIGKRETQCLTRIARMIAN